VTYISAVSPRAVNAVPNKNTTIACRNFLNLVRKPWYIYLDFLDLTFSGSRLLF
jgi:hypothetical protein